MQTLQWLFDALRPLYRKAEVVVFFVKICLRIGTHPRKTADQILCGTGHIVLGPKLCASMGLAVLIASFTVIEHVKPSTDWFYVTLGLPANEVAAFCLDFKVSKHDAEYLYVLQDTDADEFARVSHQIESLAGSTSDTDIALYLDKLDASLARDYISHAKSDAGRARAINALTQIILMFFILLGGAIYHLSVRPKSISLKTSITLTQYFFGYYGLFIASNQAIDWMIYKTDLSFLFSKPLGYIETIFLTTQYCIFLNRAHRRSTPRVLFALLIAVASMSTCILIFAEIIVNTTSAPAFARLIQLTG
ncbi:hypothetical protein P3T23_008533 [Paraburkholderia sp. GAS448]|uniref:hypothetical protein n=1 Tax=Paraburkholderia sp. GAS448 TaxID=3035136 RepID=UPI003D1DF61C